MARRDTDCCRRCRLFLRASGSLLLGLLTTWAVTWTLAIYTGSRGDGHKIEREHSPDTGSISVRRTRVTGSDELFFFYVVWGDATVPADWLAQQDLLPSWSATRSIWEVGRAVPRGVPMDMSTKKLEPKGMVMSCAAWWEHCYGWPMPCLSMLHGRIGDPHGGIRLPKSLAFWTADSVDLPCRPRWLALLLDTLVLAALWLGSVVGLRSVQHHWRLRRGHCPACGYDLRGDLDGGCPECGWRRSRGGGRLARD